MKKIAFLLIIALAFWGCTTLSQSYKLGTEAALNKNWDEAVKHYERAALENPKDSVYRLALLRARIAASYSHLFNARQLASQGKKNEALAEYEIAISYDPYNRRIAEEAKWLMEGKVKEEKPKREGIELPVKLQVSPEKMKLKIGNGATLRSIFQALGKHAQINILFDEQFKDKPFSIDLADMDFEQAIGSLCLASKNFSSIIDEKTSIIVPDTPQKRIQYEVSAIKTFYLSNIKADEIRPSLQQLLRSQYKMPTIIVNKNLNSLSVRDAPAVIELAGRLIDLWDKPKGEVIIDLEIMEVSRIKLKEYGLDLNQYGVGLEYIGPEGPDEEGWFNLKDLDFSKSENFLINLPISFLNLLESDSDTKIIAQPRLRGVDGEEIKYMVGDKIPIPRTTFTPFAAGGISQQPVTSFDYEDVGIDIKITPKIHFENEVTLELEIKIRAIGGTGVADIPIITTREVKNVIRLRDGETNLLAGLLKDEERKSVKGIIGLKNIPILGSLFSSSTQTIQQTDVILTITPHIIRKVDISEDDLKPLWVNLKGSSSTSVAQRSPERMDVLDSSQQRRIEEMRTREEPRENQISLNPGNFEVAQNREFRVSVNLRTGDEIGNISISLSFNAQVLTLKQIVAGGLVSRLGKNTPFLKNIDNSSGMCTIGISSTDLSKGFKGSGMIASLVFVAKAKGESAISFSNVSANGPSGKALSFETREARVRVR